MRNALRYLGQVVLYAGFAVLIGYFADSPDYRYLGPGLAQVKVSVMYAGERLQPCRRFTPEELARLPPNMRRPTKCSRERVPLVFELLVDGQRVFAGTYEPAGLWKDGPSHIYRRFNVPAGRREITARLRSTARTTGFDYEKTAVIDLAPGRNLVVDFQPQQGGLVIG